MKLVRKAGQSEIEGSFEELANTLALWLGENSALYQEIYNQITQGQWTADLTPEACAAIVPGSGLTLLNDDGTPASDATVVRLRQRAWERLREIVEMEAEEALEPPPDTPGWP